MSEAGDRTFFRSLETHRVRGFVRLMRHLPSDPRCAVCRAPYGGVGGRVMGRLGFAPSRKNPRLCSQCFEKAPMGGVEMEVGILFADVRGFTSLAERQAPDEVAALLNRFYATRRRRSLRARDHRQAGRRRGDGAVPPARLPGEPAQQHGRATRANCSPRGYGEKRPWVEIGVGLDFGSAFVGNVGAGERQGLHRDRRRRQHRRPSAGGRGERGDRDVQPRARSRRRSGERRRERELALKGKSEPEVARVSRLDP